MPDDEKEAGLRWWLRYIVVPLIGGGGAIAIVVAVLDYKARTNDPAATHPAATTSQSKPDTPSKSTDTSIQSSPPLIAPVSEKSANSPSMNGNGGTPTKHPHPPPPEVAPDPIEEFRIRDTETSTDFEGRNITLDWGTKYWVIWKVNKDLLKGSLILHISVSPGGSDEKSVALVDTLTYKCPSLYYQAAVERFELSEVMDDDTRRSLGTVTIHCKAAE
jgi:hypothetical protein